MSRMPSLPALLDLTRSRTMGTFLWVAPRVRRTDDKAKVAVGIPLGLGPLGHRLEYRLAARQLQRLNLVGARVGCLAEHESALGAVLQKRL